MIQANLTVNGLKKKLDGFLA